MYRERASASTGGVAWSSVIAAAGEPPHRVVPDGCIDVIFTDGTLVVAGPDTRPHLAPSRPGSVHLGLRFAPGWAPGVLGTAAHELLDRRVPLDGLWSAAAVRRLREEVGDALVGHDPDRALASLETALAVAIARVGGPEGWVPVAVGELDQGRAVRQVADDLGFSERQFQRRAHEVFGYGPKLLARVRRLERASTLAQAGQPLATVAASTGYTDQAHLSRDARALAGVSMTELLQERAASAA